MLLPLKKDFFKVTLAQNEKFTYAQSINMNIKVALLVENSSLIFEKSEFT